MNEKAQLSTDGEQLAVLNGSTPSKYECDKMKAEKDDQVSTGSGSLSTEQEIPDRGEWGGKLDFIMSLVSYAVGLGNIWRFPYLCYRNGGAVFLIPYIFFLIMCGMPLFLIEVSYGQFASLSPITIWHISPLFRGVGYGMVIISGIVCIYYNVIITWTLFYLFKSFNKVLPWSTCGNPWNTDRCALQTNNASIGYNETLDMTTAGSSVMTTVAGVLNETASNVSKLHLKSPSEEFWERHVLELTDGIENLGGIRWELFGCLVLAWILVFLVLIKGVKSAGKVMYFTAVFPYIVLTCLLVRSLTLEGSLEGIKFYVIPQWEKLLTLRIWGEAAMQIFYSVGAAWGALITMASFNKFDHNCYKDAFLIPILNCATSIFAGFIIFSIIGFMAHETGSSIHDVITQGPGLVFVVYPEAISKFPLPQLWAVLFFAMLLSIGIGSQVGMFNTVTSAFIDEFDFLKSRKLLLTATVCAAEFLLGVPCITRGGIYYLQVMDWYCATFSLMILSFIELMVIAWVYGINRFYKDMQLMLGFQPCAYWKYMWSFITPALILFVLGFSIVIHSPVTYGNYNYPGWAIGIGWIFALASLVPVPILAVIGYRRVQAGTFLSRVKKATRPNAEWGPALDEDRLNYYQSLKAEGSDFVTEEMLDCLNRPHVILHKAIDLNSTLNLKNISNLNLRAGTSLQDLKENSIV